MERSAVFLLLCSLLLYSLVCTPVCSVPLPPQDPECQTLLDSASSIGEHHMCPSDVTLKEATSCSFPGPRDRGRSSCHLQVDLKPKEPFCLKMDDPQNVTCCVGASTASESSKAITCWCHFDADNLDIRHCHLYTYWVAGKYLFIIHDLVGCTN